MEPNQSIAGPSFIYKPLPNHISIRLVKIYLGDGILACSLINDDISSSQYDALSYPWGDPHPVKSVKLGTAWEVSPPPYIICGGARMEIIRNLYDALYQFREHDIFGPLWVDALCIDQQNLHERGTQVAMMSDIYANAQQVLIWLGKEDEGTKETACLMSTFAEALDAPGYLDTRLAFNFEDSRFFEYINHPVLAEREWQLISDVFARNWFKRGWVIQELALSKQTRIFCGKVQFIGDDLAIVTAFLIHSGWWLSPIWLELCSSEEAVDGINAYFAMVWVDRQREQEAILHSPKIKIASWY